MPAVNQSSFIILGKNMIGMASDLKTYSLCLFLSLRQSFSAPASVPHHIQSKPNPQDTIHITLFYFLKNICHHLKFSCFILLWLFFICLLSASPSTLSELTLPSIFTAVSPNALKRLVRNILSLRVFQWMNDLNDEQHDEKGIITPIIGKEMEALRI